MRGWSCTRTCVCVQSTSLSVRFVLNQNRRVDRADTRIGRAIRHRNDWAALVFVDSRYATPRVKDKLPGWIGGQLQTPTSYGQAAGQLARFFAAKKRAAVGAT